MKKIVFGTTEVEVTNCYAFRYTDDRVVLRFECPNATGVESNIRLLESNTNPIQYFEDSELKVTYDNYLGDLTYNYINGVYSVELARLSAVEIAMNKTVADIEYLSIMTGVEL